MTEGGRQHSRAGASRKNVATKVVTKPQAVESVG